VSAEDFLFFFDFFIDSTLVTLISRIAAAATLVGGGDGLRC
jgi:hypothetical protein